MAKSFDSSDPLGNLRQEFLPFLLSCSDAEQSPELLSRLARCLGADGAVLWRVEEEQLVPQATFGCLSREWATTAGQESAGAAAWRGGASIVFEPDRAPYGPAAAQQFAKVAAIPIRGPKGCVGSVELAWSAGRRLPASVESLCADAEKLLAQVLPGLLAHETDRQDYLRAISRLMMLYDVGKVFHSTLDPEELSRLVVARVQNIVEADAAAVWLLDPRKKNLYCAASTGTREAAAWPRLWASDAGLGAAVTANEAVLLHDVEDPTWTTRWGSPVRSLMVIPLISEGRPLGAIEAIRRGLPIPFAEEDLRVALDVAKQAVVALRNAQRHQAERRVKELHALMEISKEITATLNLDAVLASTVNRITTVIPVDRCSVSILRKGRLEVNAISGELKVDRTSAAVRELEAMHAWLAGLGNDLSVTETEEGIETEHDDVREKFTAYFRESGFRALTGLLLRDEEGAVGVLVLESKDPESLTPSHNDLARIFANQVTVAVRNALLYQQVPLIGVLQPILEKRSKWAALPAVRRRGMIAAGIAVLAFLVFFPWWSKPSGEALVLPARVLPVSAEVQGVVRRVLVHEGDRVTAGQELAELASDEQRVALERAQAQYDILSRRVLQLEAEGNLGGARIERARWEQAAADLNLYRTQLAQTAVRCPISGVVLTPRLEERVGQDLRRGDVFCQVADLGHAWAEVAVPELDVGEIRTGQQAWLKLNTYPARKFVGRVIQVSPQAREESEDRFFDVIVEVANADGALRAGMMGRGKILAQRASVGYLLLRAPARWIWLKVWKWLP